MTTIISPKYFHLEDNATLTSWTPRGWQESILFTEQQVFINGEQKLRGGAPVCSPIFGAMPETPEYTGLDIPKHGFLRGVKHAHGQDRTESEENAIVHNSFQKPWRHEVVVRAETSHDGHTLQHEVVVSAQDRMPLSLGFHPYFSTHGKDFRLTHKSAQFTKEDIPHDSLFFLEGSINEPLLIEFNNGKTTSITLEQGYERFCIWTDNIAQYICIEPVMGAPKGYAILDDRNPTFVARCTLAVH